MATHSTDEEECVAIRRRSHDCFGANIPPAARPVLDDKWLAEPLRQPITHQARENVGDAARSEWNNQAYRARRITLRTCDARESREGGSARGQGQKLSAGKFHRALT